MSKNDYLKEIIELLEKIEDESLLYFVLGFLEKQVK